jgi:plasmid maintenance system antidote protein VapI
MYKEKASEIVNLEFYKFEWQGKEITQIEAIDVLIETSKNYILMDEFEMSDEMVIKIRENFYKSMELWGKILHHMWW